VETDQIALARIIFTESMALDFEQYSIQELEMEE
jgi:hypothetical protein